MSDTIDTTDQEYGDEDDHATAQGTDDVDLAPLLSHTLVERGGDWRGQGDQDLRLGLAGRILGHTVVLATVVEVGIDHNEVTFDHQVTLLGTATVDVVTGCFETDLGF